VLKSQVCAVWLENRPDEEKDPVPTCPRRWERKVRRTQTLEGTRANSAARYTVAATSATSGKALDATVPITLPPRGRQ
jgi:hypothetical protein